MSGNNSFLAAVTVPPLIKSLVIGWAVSHDYQVVELNSPCLRCVLSTMKSESIHFPVETIRSALSKFNKKNDNSDSSKKVISQAGSDSCGLEQWGGGGSNLKKLNSKRTPQRGVLFMYFAKPRSVCTLLQVSYFIREQV
jgi:hypothetical protein